jgi:hypothetical protein
VSLSQEQAETEVTLTVAECGEFHNLGEFYENIPTVEEAVAIWKQIPPECINGITPCQDRGNGRTELQHGG